MAIREVNLIDPGILLRRHTQRHLIFWAVCLAAVLSLIGGVFLFQAHAVSVKNNSRRPLKQLHTNLELKISEVKTLQAELKTLRSQQDTVESIVKKQPFYRILAKLADIINQQTWITQLTLEPGKKSSRSTHLKLVGFAGSNNDLGDFISRLTHESMFSAVELKFAQENETMQTTRNINAAAKKIQFQITCDITSTKG